MNAFDLDAVLSDPKVLVTVLTKPQTQQVVGVSNETWHRLERRGETPPKTQLSDNRIGYRLIDVMKWLDARRHHERGGEAA
jgi:predicted DNA-binding transcriptional regulator AlpA